MKHIKIIIGAISIACFVMGNIYFILKQHTISTQLAGLNVKLSQKLRAIRTHLNEVLLEAQTFSTFSEIQHLYQQKKVTTQQLEAIKNTYKKYDYTSLSFFDTAGNLLFSTEKQPFEDHKAYILQAIHISGFTLKPQIHQLYFDTVRKYPLFLLVIPIIEDMQVKGILTLEKKDTALNTIIGQTQNNVAFFEEIILGKMINNMLIIMNTNLSSTDAYNVYLPQHSMNAAPLDFAATGDRNSGVILDYKKTKKIAAWSYIPEINCGIIIKVDYQSVLTPLMWMKTLLIVLFIILATLLFFVLSISFFNQKTVTRASIKLYMAMVCCMSGGIGCYFLYQIHSLYKTSKINSLSDVSLRNKIIGQGINNVLYSAQVVGTALAHACTTGKVTQKNLREHLTQLLKESSIIQEIVVAYAPYALNSTTQLYAPTVERVNDSIIYEDSGKKYNYPTEGNTHLGMVWDRTMQTQQMNWNPTHYLTITKKLGLTFAIPFYSDTTYTTIQGVIMVSIHYETLKNFINSVNFNSVGYTLIIDDNNNFIYHPDNAYITEHKQFSDLPIEHTSEGQKIYAELKEKSEGTISFTTANNQKGWIFFNTLNFPPFKILSILDASNIPLPYDELYRTIMWSILCFVIALSSILLIIIPVFSFNTQALLHYCIGYSVVLLIALYSIYYFHQKYAFYTKINNPLQTTTELTQYLNDKNQKALNNHQASSQPLRTGILINFFDISQKNYISFSGKAWQIYPKDGPAPKTITFLQATKQTVTEIRHEEYDAKSMIVWWDIGIQIYQTIDYLRFPFEAAKITLNMTADYATKNIFLIPDLARYQERAKETNSISGTKILPGINLQAEIPGFIVKEALFSYNTNLTEPLSSESPLTFNIILNQKVITPLMIYFLPILVIIISIFGVLWINEVIKRKTDIHKWQPSLATIGAYSALLFSTIALHREIRKSYSSGHLLYIEYLFIFIYMAMFSFEIISSIAPHYIKTRKDSFDIMTLIRFLFWPIVLTYWFIVTFLIFYK